ncbi:SMP-30/gluconolactonase/LRE family protein [Yoonia sediminilitoris]|uniref:Sugar lactone lactonase YvrE n=1 Tax=Yoonia sediminilitoris TaxID=1286148 RepID=A0A2T6K7K9_9RHOB|nr:SMP-30/gluconolactonase/LRE family protein [Yoonia sediminilitoris]PUB10686.1 sugar lactone lactonase YvrE [Yoonia sediminilitoris]RCW90438.1 sugar lactone lactonase YvrE [Yoonia sediminilitoris]
MIYDDTTCTLGEGPLWHPQRQQFFWFDILEKRLHTKGHHWQFDEYVSAAGWVDDTTLMIASSKQLMRFDLETGAQKKLCDLEANNPVTRSNDGRADPQGGFWIGTMGINAEPQAGAIYRYYKGELRKLVADVTISNAICFAPDGQAAFYVDTEVGKIMKWQLGSDGWPDGVAEVHLDLSGERFGVDGAVVDATGNLWNAQWGAGRVAQYAPDGSLLQTVSFPATQTSCPAFGGKDLKTLYCTSAATDLDPAGTDDGKTFCVTTDTAGQTEHQVLL